MLRYYYFTFGTDPDYPFAGGWVTVAAPSRQAAVQIFLLYYPNETGADVLNCADVYTEEEFKETGMEETGNFGAFCHAVIEPREEGEFQMSLPKISPCRCGHQPELECGKESIRMETRTKAIKTWNYGIMKEAAP